MTPEQPQVETQALTIPDQPVTQRAPLREMLEILKATDPTLVKEFARQIVEREVAGALFDQDVRLAKSFAMSGLFDNLRGATLNEAMAKAMTYVQLGRSWNMGPSDSLQYVQFFNGKPSVANEYLAARMRDAGLDWSIEWHRDQNGNCIGCTLWPSRLQGDGFKPITERVNGVDGPASVSFKKSDAQKVKTKENGQTITLDEKSTYQAYPEDLYYWRCIARLKRRYCTNILSAMPMGDGEMDGRDDTSPVIQKTLPPAAPQPMKVSAADIAPPARPKREPKPMPPAPPQDLAPVLEESLRVVQEQKAATELPPLDMDLDQIRAALGELRVAADVVGEGLFMAQVKEINPRVITPSDLMRLPIQDLASYVDLLAEAGQKQWIKNADGAWVKRLF